MPQRRLTQSERLYHLRNVWFPGMFLKLQPYTTKSVLKLISKKIQQVKLLTANWFSI